MVLPREAQVAFAKFITHKAESLVANTPLEGYGSSHVPAYLGVENVVLDVDPPKAGVPWG